MNEVIVAHVILAVLVLVPSMVILAHYVCSWYGGKLMEREDEECTPDEWGGCGGYPG